MKKHKLYLFFPAIWMVFAGIFTSCEKQDDYEPIQYIKKTYGPIIVGEKYDFAFTVASKDGSVLRNMEIEATYAGATGTELDNRCYWTTPTGFTEVVDGRAVNREGQDRSMEMLSNITSSGNVVKADIRGDVTEMNFSNSGYTSYAITVRFAYVVPEAARGKNVSFTVRWSTQKGSDKGYSTDTYDVSNMDMVKDVVLSDATDHSGKRYFSIADMTSYSLDDVNAASKSASIDFVYRYNSSDITTSGGSNVRLNHAIIAPSQTVFLDTDYVPASWTKNDTWIELRKWDDMQLKGAVPNNYIDDIDLRTADIRGVSHAEYNLEINFGTVMQTSDGVYRAYVYVKAVNNNDRTMTVGVKRLKIK